VYWIFPDVATKHLRSTSNIASTLDESKLNKATIDMVIFFEKQPRMDV